MMKEFFGAGIDYLYFIYGFAFFLLAWVCLLLHVRQKAVMPWEWLGLFGLIHGVSIWSGLFVFILGDSAFLENLRFFTAVISFLLLIEFSRRSAILAGCKDRCLWVYLLLFVLLVLEWLIAGGAALGTISNYAFGVAGCLWASLVIFRSNRAADLLVRRLFQAAGVVFMLYALTNIAAPQTLRFSQTLVNYNSFIRIFGFPLQLLQAFLSFCLAAIFWIYHYFSENIDAGYYQAKRAKYFTIVIAAFIAALILGYFITDSVGAYYKNKSRNDLLVRADTIASVLDRGRLRLLTGSSLDISTENYAYLKRQIETAHKVNRDCRFIYLMGKRGGQVFFFLDSLALSDEGHSPPGQIFDEGSPSLVQSFSDGIPFMEGPTADRWGEWVSALCPIKDMDTGKVIAVLGMDVDAGIWRRNIFDHRVVGIFAAFILMTGFFLFLQLNDTYFARIAVSRIRFDAVIKDMGDGVIICSPDYRIISINPSANKYLGICGAQNINLLDHLLSNFSVSINRDELIDPSLPHKNFDIIRQESELFKPLYLAARLDMLKSLTSEVSGIVLTLRDVTEARMEEMMKQDFLGLISHKLRTPVSVIYANACLLGGENSSEALNDKQRKFIASITEGSVKLRSLIDKLLKFVEINKARPDISKEKVVLFTYLPSLVRPMVDKSKDKKIELSIDCPQEGSALDINKSSLDIIIKNLIENAIKFNDKEIARISISVRRAAESLEIEISDNGPGIPPEDREKIFEQFYQVEKYFTGNVEGVGLGLALVKRLVDISGAEIHLRSEIAKGTTVIISFAQ
ncbi:MAG: HAMP domain-containing sensor histidine kinase [Candidatus Omnitrophota bacterium]